MYDEEYYDEDDVRTYVQRSTTYGFGRRTATTYVVLTYDDVVRTTYVRRRDFVRRTNVRTTTTTYKHKYTVRK